MASISGSWGLRHAVWRGEVTGAGQFCTSACSIEFELMSRRRDIVRGMKGFLKHPDVGTFCHAVWQIPLELGELGTAPRRGAPSGPVSNHDAAVDRSSAGMAPLSSSRWSSSSRWERPCRRP
jgi:hypothetical protein